MLDLKFNPFSFSVVSKRHELALTQNCLIVMLGGDVNANSLQWTAALWQKAVRSLSRIPLAFVGSTDLWHQSLSIPRLLGYNWGEASFVFNVSGKYNMEKQTLREPQLTDRGSQKPIPCWRQIGEDIG